MGQIKVEKNVSDIEASVLLSLLFMVMPVSISWKLTTKKI